MNAIEYANIHGVVIQELDNYRGRTEKRYLIMVRSASRNALYHVLGRAITLQEALDEVRRRQWNLLAVGDFYQVV